MCGKMFSTFFTVLKKIVQPHPLPPRSPTFLGQIVARNNKNLLQGIIGFGRAILADTPPPPIKRG
jgi:hypothetical protein